MSATSDSARFTYRMKWIAYAHKLPNKETKSKTAKICRKPPGSAFGHHYGLRVGLSKEIASEWVWDGGNKVTLRWRSSYLDKRHNKRNCLFTVMVRKNRVGSCVKEWTISFVKNVCFMHIYVDWELGGRKKL